MRTIQLLTLTTLSLVAASTAMADDRLNLTPPLYREQARPTAAVRPAADLGTTPRLVPAAPAARKVVAEAGTSLAR